MILHAVSYLVYPAWCAVMHRARGSEFFNLAKSTFLGRLLSTMGVALGASLYFVGDIEKMLFMFFWTWSMLMIFVSPLWDKFWSEEIGHSLTHSRLYGLMQMTIRMQLILPTFIGQAIISGHPERMAYAIFALLLALPYFIFGYTKTNYVIPESEYTIGGMIGAISQCILR